MAIEFTEVTTAMPIQMPTRSQSPDTALSRVNLTFTELKGVVGALFVPSYVPAGFGIVRTVLDRERDVRLVYRAQESRSTEGIQVGSLSVRLVRRAKPEVFRGFAERIAIRGTEGLLIRGGWLVHNMQIEWASDISTAILFEESGWFVYVTGRERSKGEQYWTRSELTQIAESMTSF